MEMIPSVKFKPTFSEARAELLIHNYQGLSGFVKFSLTRSLIQVVMRSDTSSDGPRPEMQYGILTVILDHFQTTDPESSSHTFHHP
jgi:hypothetical protein